MARSLDTMMCEFPSNSVKTLLSVPSFCDKWRDVSVCSIETISSCTTSVVASQGIQLYGMLLLK
ncbi:hypothetical protein SORBI_3001G284475 [Sorghum bicolor]|uniref:Uncharacterized protein n=1 Tax=Sorghum bicolor TaxID=4558 RepID=A0A1Z5S813_SORBI|nr:hypothetical protein SORBI_3001G284475 [Sorghum bicolor]